MNNRYLLAIAVVVSLSLNGMIAYGIDDKNENDMINELIKTGQFTEDEAKDFVSKTMQNGQEDKNNQTKTTLPIASGNSGDTFNIDVNLSKGKPSPIITSSEDHSVWYELVDNNQLDVSNSSVVCPSNECKMTSYAARMIFISSDDYMALAGKFNLVDDNSNGQFNPKKQKLIEQMDFDFTCNYQDIQEDAAKKTTKYVCSEPQDGSIRRTYYDTTYPYKFTATFELPSRHLVINATEAHESPYIIVFGSNGHTVFRNEDGKIEVKQDASILLKTVLEKGDTTMVWALEVLVLI